MPQSGNANNGLAALGHNDGPVESHRLESRPRGRARQRHRRLRHRFEAHHRREETFAMINVIVHVWIRVWRQHGIDDQLHSRIENSWLFKESEEWKVRLLQFQRRRIAEAPRDDNRHRRQ